MNTARIVVLSTADGAGGIAAYLANRSDNKSLPAEPVAPLPAMDALVAKDEPVEAVGADLMAAWRRCCPPASASQARPRH